MYLTGRAQIFLSLFQTFVGRLVEGFVIDFSNICDQTNTEGSGFGAIDFVAAGAAAEALPVKTM